MLTSLNMFATSRRHNVHPPCPWWEIYYFTYKNIRSYGRMYRRNKRNVSEWYFVCVSYFQASVLQASCLVKTASVSLRPRAATSQTTAAMAQMKRIVGLPAPLRTVAAAGRAPWPIILIGCWGLGQSKKSGLRMITRWWLKMVRN